MKPPASPQSSRQTTEALQRRLVTPWYRIIPGGKKEVENKGYLISQIEYKSCNEQFDRYPSQEFV